MEALGDRRGWSGSVGLGSVADDELARRKPEDGVPWHRLGSGPQHFSLSALCDPETEVLDERAPADEHGGDVESLAAPLRANVVDATESSP